MRRNFVEQLHEQLESLEDTEILEIDGTSISEIDRFGVALAKGLDLVEAPKDVNGVRTVLREYPHEPKHLFFIWRDADVLLEADVDLFGRLVNAFIGSAAERELITLDVLVLQRIVFLGGDKLGAYAEDPEGALATWLVDGDDDPFDEVKKCLSHPPVITYRLEG